MPTGQLIDASTGAHLWADRFEGTLEDVFELQGQVTASVVGAMAPKVEQAEIHRAKQKPTDSLDVYDNYLRGPGQPSCRVRGRQRVGQRGSAAVSRQLEAATALIDRALALVILFAECTASAAASPPEGGLSADDVAAA
jgi:hypothetical protein